tara:strand:- start:7895 stop:8605 length:711 start_codon:yes stop_codon:yes gene_type:complete
MKYTKINGINIACFNSINEASDHILKNGFQKTAIAINPEKILLARKSKQVYAALEEADICFLDGIGTVFYARRKLKNNLICRIPGCDLWESLMKDSPKHNKSVFLVGAQNEVLQRTVEKLKLKYNTNIIGSADGYFSDEESVINQILYHKPDIVTVALGSPRQEMFIRKCRQHGVEAFMMGVGGTYDVFSGSANRAPKIFQNSNLEWLYRLISEPARIFRQIRLIQFIFLYIFKKL